jgi:hypothetical protein
MPRWSALPDRAEVARMIFSENRLPPPIKSGAGFFRIMLFLRRRMIFSENRLPLFRIMLFLHWRMIFAENRLPLFRIML